MPPRENVIEQMFVRQRQTEVCRADGTKNALYLLHVRRLARPALFRGEATHRHEADGEEHQ